MAAGASDNAVMDMGGDAGGYAPLFQLGPETRPFRRLDVDGVGSAGLGGRDFLTVSPEAISTLAAAAFTDLAHRLRPDHLQQLRSILDDPEASANDRFVALELLKNAVIAAGGAFPMCQDTGTAIVFAKKGQYVLDLDGDDEAALSAGHRQRLCQKTTCATAKLAPLDLMLREVRTRAPTCRPRSISMPYREAATPTFTSSSSWPRAADRRTRPSFINRRRKADLLNPEQPERLPRREDAGRSAPPRVRPITWPSSSAAPRPSTDLEDGQAGQLPAIWTRPARNTATPFGQRLSRPRDGGATDPRP